MGSQYLNRPSRGFERSEFKSFKDLKCWSVPVSGFAILACRCFVVFVFWGLGIRSLSLFVGVC